MLINRSRFLCALCYSPRQLSLCELSIVLAEATPVRQSPAIISLLCGRATYPMERGDGGLGEAKSLPSLSTFPILSPVSILNQNWLIPAGPPWRQGRCLED